MTPQDIIDQLNQVTIEAGDKFVIDTKIDPLTTTPEQATKIITEQVNTLLGRGVSPENIGIVGLPKEFADLNAVFESTTAGLGSAFGGVFDTVNVSMDSYLSDLDGLIDNKINLAQSAGALLPENIPVDQALVTKFARAIEGSFGELFAFPDTFQAEERPIDGKTPLSDWKDRTNVVAETAGGGTLEEKKSLFAAEYGKNVVYKSNSGHFIEMDDTEGAERINIQHKNGTFITLMPDKSIVIRAQGGVQIITYGDGDMFVAGNINITCIGDANISTNGNINIDTVKDVNWNIGGKLNIDAKDDINLRSSKDLKQSAAGSTNIKSDGKTIVGGSSLEVDAVLNVNGSTNLTATGVDTGGDKHNLKVAGSGSASPSEATKLGEVKEKEYKLGS